MNLLIINLTFKTNINVGTLNFIKVINWIKLLNRQFKILQATRKNFNFIKRRRNLSKFFTKTTAEAKNNIQLA